MVSNIHRSNRIFDRHVDRYARRLDLISVDLDHCLVSTRDSPRGGLSVGRSSRRGLSRQRRALRHSLFASKASVALESREE